MLNNIALLNTLINIDIGQGYGHVNQDKTIFINSDEGNGSGE